RSWLMPASFFSPPTSSWWPTKSPPCVEPSARTTKPTAAKSAAGGPASDPRRFSIFEFRFSFFRRSLPRRVSNFEFRFSLFRLSVRPDNKLMLTVQHTRNSSLFLHFHFGKTPDFVPPAAA